MTKQLWVDVGNVPRTCGLQWVGNFGTSGEGWDAPDYNIEGITTYGINTGFFVAGFIKTNLCKEVYEYLTSKHKLIYQSPVRYNQNSGNNFFFCIFDRV